METLSNIDDTEASGESERVPNLNGHALPNVGIDYDHSLIKEQIPFSPSPIQRGKNHDFPLSHIPVKAVGRDLRKNYTLSIQIGFVLSLLIVIGLFRIPLQMEDSFDVILVEQETVQMEEITQTKQKVEAPPPRRPPVPVEVPNDEIILDEELDLDVALDLDEMLVDLQMPKMPPEEEPEPEEAEIFVVVEEMPVIIGGTAKLYEYVIYPELAQKAQLQGTVVIQFVVETEGIAGEVTVLRSVHKILDEAAVEAIQKLRFIPGKQRGKLVRVKMSIPIRFKLK